MKKKVLLLAPALLGMLLTGCDDGEKDPSPSSIESSSSESEIIQPSSSSNDDYSSSYEESMIQSYKNQALAKLDELINSGIAKITNERLKSAVQNYYNNQKQYIQGITDLNTAMEAVDKIIADTTAFIKDVIKPLAIEEIEAVINPLIDKITYASLKNSIQEFFDTEMQKLSEVESLSDLADLFIEIIEDTKQFITTETEKILTELKNKAIAELDPYVQALIKRIPYQELENDVMEFYEKEKAILLALDSFEGIEPCVEQIKLDLEKFALAESKKIALAALQKVIDAGLEKLPNEAIKNDLNEFAAGEIAKLNAIAKLEDIIPTLEKVIKETGDYIKNLLISTIKTYIARLTAIERATAYDYLPASMQPNYAPNLINPASLKTDFSSFVQISDINSAGFGEQWQMVVENINQSVLLAKVFNVAQTALNAVGNAVDIYITNSYADEIDYSFGSETDGYTARFVYKNNKLIFNINLTESYDIPAIGSFKPIIKMEYDLTKEAKGMFVSLGDVYKIKYVISDNCYEMASNYGIDIAGKTAYRSSYLLVEKNNNLTTGHIYEFTTIAGSDVIKACADFYINDDYVSVVGNKASGMIGFDGYVNELYSKDSGKLLASEVRETKTISMSELTHGIVPDITKTYDTMWFNLKDIQGINSIKVLPYSKDNDSPRSTADVYLNNNTSSLFSPTYNKTLAFKTSRKYDIELRSRFYYYYDQETETYKAYEAKIPMMFIQEGEEFESFSSDFKKDNGFNASVSLDEKIIAKLNSDYHTLIDVFILNEKNITSEDIDDYLEGFEN